jgi:hypothetical protein
MNVIGGFSAPLNGVRRGHPAKMSSRQKQETPSSGFSGTPSMTNVENAPPGMKRGGMLLAYANSWIAMQDDEMSRPEANRRLVELG